MCVICSTSLHLQIAGDKRGVARILLSYCEQKRKDNTVYMQARKSAINQQRN